MIVGVALKTNWGYLTLPAPARHCDAMRAASELGWWGPFYAHSQGFVDDAGRFLSREEALVEAIKAEQVKGPLHGGTLTSEDLW